MALNDIQNIPSGNLMLLVGPPDSGKTTFCNQTVIKAIEEKPIIYITNESPPSRVKVFLAELGLSKVLPESLCYVDSYNRP